MTKPAVSALVPLLAALALGAAEKPADGTVTPGGALTPAQQTFWNDAQAGGATAEAQVAAEAVYLEARALYQAARFVEARERIEEAIRIYPPHQPAQQLREDILAVLGLRDNRLKQAAVWLGNIQDVKTQEMAVRMAAKMAEGEKQMAAGDFAAAELAYDSVDIALRTFPYQFDWGNLPADVAAKRLEARAQDRRNQLERQQGDRQRAEGLAEERRRMEEEALESKVDEMLRRARVAYDRKDFKRAEVDAWNAYELDRRREDARELYLKSRRKGHAQFDDLHRENRLERIARVHEEVHKSLIPQSELLVYPEDWQRRSLRKPSALGSTGEEPWMAAINARMQVPLEFEFEDASLEDVMEYFRKVTGVNIIVAPEVFADGSGTITFRAKDMRFREALKWVLEMTKLHMALQNQAIFIAKTPITGAVLLRMYDVQDLISPVRDFPSRELAYASGGGGGGGGGGFDLFAGGAIEEGTAVDPDQLAEFIKTNVAPEEQWGEGTALDNRGGTFFVSQTPEIHARIEELLANMRLQQALQVHVNVRMLDVRKGFFEEIGFEYHDEIPATAPPGAASGLINASGTQGYERANTTEHYNGTLGQQLPGNQTDVAYSAGSNGQFRRGLAVEGSWNIGSFLGVDQVNAIFSAVEEETDAQVLQHPALTCFNGQRAHCSFMNQYAYISDYEVVNNNLDPTIDVLTFGEILDVRPVISSDRKYITMEIRPSSVSLVVPVFVEIIQAPRVVGDGGNGGVVSANTFGFPIELPNVLVRTLRSTVMLPDKGTLLIGGFGKSLRQRVHTGIPFLSHIPFLGRLFSRNGSYDENRRLFFLLNAEIVDLGEKEALQ
ncbi:MAG: hypothetical protein H0W72_15450 [Planctomycetes bacterium]|nr:hypothetical protein [Planctomycetota bacterium]